MISRIGVDVLFVVVAVLLPWWFFVLLTAVAVLTLPFFVEGIVILLIQAFFVGVLATWWFWLILLSLMVILWVRETIIRSYLRNKL